jgi:hypothetical protein
MRAQFPVAHIERLVIDQQPDELAVGDVDHRLPRLGIAVSRLGVRQRPQLAERVQVRARKAGRFPLIQVPPQPDVAVGQREHRLRLGEHIQVQPGLANRPRLRPECRMLDHGASGSPVSGAGLPRRCPRSATATRRAGIRSRSRLSGRTPGAPGNPHMVPGLRHRSRTWLRGSRQVPRRTLAALSKTSLPAAPCGELASAGRAATSPTASAPAGSSHVRSPVSGSPGEPPGQGADLLPGGCGRPASPPEDDRASRLQTGRPGSRHAGPMRARHDPRHHRARPGRLPPLQLIAFRSTTLALIPLYAGVFTGFTLSQAGLAVRSSPAQPRWCSWSRRSPEGARIVGPGYTRLRRLVHPGRGLLPVGSQGPRPRRHPRAAAGRVRAL